MTGIPAPRLEELLENLSRKDTAPIHEWIQDYEEAIRLATYSGQSDTVSFLIDGYMNSFHHPVPLEVRFYCVFYEAVKHWRAGRFLEARSRYSTAREIALSGGDELGAARCLMASGVTLWAEGDYKSALPVLEEAEEVLRQVRDITLSNCLNWLGVVCGNLELLSRAWKYYREALELNRELGLTQSQAFLLCNMGLLCQQMGLYDQAEESYRESLELQKQCGNRYGYADSLANLGMLVLKKHRKPEDAFKMLLEAAEMQLENDDINKAGLVLANAAAACCSDGDDPRGMELFDRAEELVFSTKHGDSQVEFLGLKAEACISRGDYDTAEELCDRAMAIRGEMLPGKPDKLLLRVQADLHRRKGNFQRAYDLLQESILVDEEVERVRSEALQSVIQVIGDAARKNRDIQEARHQAALLEERNTLLTANEERFRAFLHALAGMGIMALDQEGRITFWNRTCGEIYGYCSHEVSGRAVSDLLIPIVPGNDTCSLMEMCLQGEDFEAAFRTADGSLREVSVTPVLLSSGELFLVQVDLTEQRRAEARKNLIENQMRRAQKLEALGTLAGGIAHDFNNLLQGILGNASLLCSSLVPGTRESVSAGMIRTAAERSAELCAQMLDYAGIGPMGLEPLDIEALVSELTPLLRTSLPGGASLEVERLGDLPPVKGNASQIRQIIMNLAVNGAEAIQGQGSVIIRTGQRTMDRCDFADSLIEDSPESGEFVFLQVEDQGTGIPSDTMTRIFDPFFSTKRTGRGLGLAAVLGIVRGHSGGLTVDSEPGKGSVFTVYLPTEDGAVSPETSNEGGESPGDLSGTRIMVVDDEEIVRETVCAILESAGSRPLPLPGGAEALAAIQSGQEPFDMMVLDLTMPGLSGVDVFNAMQEMDVQLPVLIISGYSREKLSSLFAGHSPGGFLQKPFKPEDLVGRILSILN